MNSIVFLRRGYKEVARGRGQSVRAHVAGARRHALLERMRAWCPCPRAVLHDAPDVR
jgi:hypothetical protein